jgi:cell growth-regulating nucleolar protein
MVTFVCESCNETLKKNQVEKHGQRCRQCRVTCVDCSRTFTLGEYGAHTSCVSEAEKYEKSLYKAKPNAKANPQETWMDLIHEAARRKHEAPSNIAEHIGRLGDLDNVPRNPKKFANFAKNSLRISNDAVLDSMWKFLQKLVAEKESQKDQQQQQQQQQVQAQERQKVHQPQEQQEHVVAADDQRAESTKDKKRKEKKRKMEASSSGGGTELGGIADETAPTMKKKKRQKHSEESGGDDDVAAEKAKKKAKKEKKKARKEKKEKAES